MNHEKIIEQLAYMYSLLKKAVPNAQVGHEFTATPAVENTLIKKLTQQGGWFFDQGFATIMPVTLQKGSKIKMAMSENIARTKATTPSNPRLPAVQESLENQDYLCQEILHDLLLTYAQLDAWAEFSNEFVNMYSQLRMEAMINSLVKIGWYGTSRASTSDIGTNTNMQDVAKGWLQWLIDWNTANPSFDLYTTGLTLGGTDYPTFDSFVYALKQSIPNYLRNDLICLVSDDILGWAGGNYYEQVGSSAKEKTYLALNGGVVLDAYAGLKTYVPPFFPDKTVLVTARQNLMLYMQRGSVRRRTWDRPDFSGIADYNSANYAYVVNEERQAALSTALILPA